MQWYLPFNKKDLEKVYKKGRLDTQLELSSSMIGRVTSDKSIDTITDEEMMEESKNKEEILKYCEFETKYRIDDSKRFAFKKIMEDDLGLKGDKFLYVQSGDEYFTLNLNNKLDKYMAGQKDPDGKIRGLIEGFITEVLDLPKFLRYRASEDKKIKQKELTFKRNIQNKTTYKELKLI